MWGSLSILWKEGDVPEARRLVGEGNLRKKKVQGSAPVATVFSKGQEAGKTQGGYEIFIRPRLGEYSLRIVLLELLNSSRGFQSEGDD